MLTNFLTNLGFTRDWAGWFWGRVVSGAVLILGIAASGSPVLDPYVSPGIFKWIKALAVVVLWFSGKYDSSDLPAAKP